MFRNSKELPLPCVADGQERTSTKRMTDTQSRGLKFAYFVLGVAFPVLAFALWTRNKDARRMQVDKAHDVTVEDSFPASDPPSSW